MMDFKLPNIYWLGGANGARESTTINKDIEDI